MLCVIFQQSLVFLDRALDRARIRVAESLEERDGAKVVRGVAFILNLFEELERVAVAVFVV